MSKVFTKSENFKSEYSCAVVRIGKLTSIEGSDFLAKTDIFGVQIVVRKDQTKEGDLAIYAAHETQLNESFLSANNLFEIDSLLPKEKAVEVANILRKQGYKDVHVERYYTISPQLKSYLWQEFNRNNLPKYYKYFEQWVNNLTYNQIVYFTAYMLERKTI